MTTVEDPAPTPFYHYVQHVRQERAPAIAGEELVAAEPTTAAGCKDQSVGQLARSSAISSARRVITVARCRRYSAGA